MIMIRKKDLVLDYIYYADESGLQWKVRVVLQVHTFQKRKSQLCNARTPLSLLVLSKAQRPRVDASIKKYPVH